jgi:hypothetical protein
LKHINHISECIFYNCCAINESIGHGGGLFFIINDVSSTYLLLSHIFFKDCKSSIDSLDVYVEGSDLSIISTYGTDDVFDLSRSQSSFDNINKLIIKESNSNENLKDMSCLLPPYLSSIIYIGYLSTEAYKVINKHYCGTEYIRCRSISYGDDTLNPSEDYIINISSGEYEEWKLTSRTGKRRELKGESRDKTIITVVTMTSFNYPLFYIPQTINNSTLSMNNITFILNISNSFIKVESMNCILIMEDLIIVCGNGITLKSSAIKILNGYAFISRCDFTNISLIKTSDSEGDDEGGVFYITIESMGIVEFTNSVTFENCGVNTEGISNGGAIYANLKNGYFYVHGGTSFKNCLSKSSIGTEGKG